MIYTMPFYYLPAVLLQILFFKLIDRINLFVKTSIIISRYNGYLKIGGLKIYRMIAFMGAKRILSYQIRGWASNHKIAAITS